MQESDEIQGYNKAFAPTTPEHQLCVTAGSGGQTERIWGAGQQSGTHPPHSGPYRKETHPLQGLPQGRKETLNTGGALGILEGDRNVGVGGHQLAVQEHSGGTPGLVVVVVGGSQYSARPQSTSPQALSAKV